MFIIILAILYYILLSSMRIDKPSKIVLVVFSAYWFFALYMSTLSPYGLDIPSLGTYVMLVVLVISFTLGFLIVRPITKFKPSYEKSLQLSCSQLVDNIFFKVVVVVVAGYTLSKLIIFRDSLILYQSSAMMRDGFFDGSLYGAEFPYINLFLSPLFVFLSPIFFYQCFHKRNIFCICNGLFLLGYTIISVSRFGFVRIFLAFFLMEFVLSASQFTKKRKLIISGIIGVIAFFAIALTTIVRSEGIGSSLSSGEEKTQEHLITYTCGPIVAFDKAIHNHYVEDVGGYQWGGLTLTSFESLLKMVLDKTIGVDINVSINNFSFKQERIIRVGKNHTWNALYTAAAFFYLDLDVIGIAIFPFLIGVLFRLAMIAFFRRPSYAALVIVYMFFKGAVFSVIDYDFVDPFYSLMLIGLVLYESIHKKRKCISVSNVSHLNYV